MDTEGTLNVLKIFRKRQKRLLHALCTSIYALYIGSILYSYHKDSIRNISSCHLKICVQECYEVLCIFNF